MPRISVIIPSYNRRDFLEKSVQSVLKQSFDDFELIIVDDASTDTTSCYLESLSDSRITCIKLERNCGVSKARNIGILKARGDYIAFLDSDDQWHRKKLEKQMAYIEQNPNCVILHCNEVWMRNGEHLNQKKIHRKEGGDIFERALQLCLISPSAVVLKRSYLQSVGLFREDFPVCEDYELWLRITAHNKVDFIEEALITKFGGHLDQLSSRYKAMDYWRVKAMDELQNRGNLSEEKSLQLKKALVQKCQILKAGYLKHENLENLEYIDSLLQKYGE